MSVQSMGEVGKDFCPNFLQSFLVNVGVTTVEYLVFSKFPFSPNTRSTCYGPARRIVFLHDLCNLTVYYWMGF